MTSYALQRRATDCGITVSSVNPGMVSHIYCIVYIVTYAWCVQGVKSVNDALIFISL